MAASLQQRLQGVVARATIGLPDALVRTLAGKPITCDGRTLDAQVQLMLRSQRAAGLKAAHLLPLEEARREIDFTGDLLGLAPRPAVASVSDRPLAGRGARLFRPLGEAPPGGWPALLYLHGGGHTIGSLESHAGVCQMLAASLSAVVVALDYRLGPEHRFPAASDDCTAAFRALVAEASTLGVDPRRIGVGGDSAGGNLSAVVSLDTRGDAVRPRVQLLLYPVLDLTTSFPSMESLGHGFFLESETVRWFATCYLGPDGDPRHPRASPWFAPDLRDLPPAVVVTAGFDPLRDEGDAYARRLGEAGVAVDHRSYPSLFHGFFNTGGVIRAARVAIDEIMALVRSRL